MLEWYNAPMDAALLILNMRNEIFLWFGSVYEYLRRADLWMHMVCLKISWIGSRGDLNRWLVFKAYVWPKAIKLVWIILVIPKYWGWTTQMFRKEKVLICLQAIKVCPIMWLHHKFWCRVIGENYDGFVMNPNLYLLTLKGDELMVSFEDFSQVCPMWILWCLCWISAQWW